MPRASGRMMVEARRSVRPLLTLSVIIAAALVAGGIVAGKLTFQRPWISYRTVKAEFDDAKGIFPGGDTVRIHGVVAGVVASSQLTNGHAVLTLQLESKYGPIYKDAQLRIRPVTPLEDLYVDVIDRGHPSAGEASGDDVIPPAQTVTPVDVSRVLDTFDANTRERMTILLSELNRGLPDGGAQLRAAFVQLAPFLQVARQATSVLHQHDSETQQLIHNLGLLSSSLATRDQALSEFVRSGNATLGTLANRQPNLSRTLSELAALLPTLQSSFASVRSLTATLNPALDSLRPVTANLQGGLAGLQRLGRTATPALAALQAPVTNLRTMARQLAPTTDSLSSTFQHLQTEAPSFAHLTSLSVPCLSMLNKFFNQTLSVFKFSDSKGAFPRADETIDFDAGAQFGGRALNLRGPVKNCAGATG